jgi:hypothetical protein
MITCKSCDTEVPPNWVHAINTNACPSCGCPLLNENEASLLEEIREAFRQMPDSPEGLAGWLISNYKMVKIGDGQAVKISKPVSPATETTFAEVEEDTAPGKKAADRIKFEGMLKRAGVKPPDSDRLKNLVKGIKSGAVDSDPEITVQDEELYDDGDVFVSASDEDPAESAMIDALSSGKTVDPKMFLRQQKLNEARAAMREGGSVGKISRSGG